MFSIPALRALLVLSAFAVLGCKRESTQPVITHDAEIASPESVSTEGAVPASQIDADAALAAVRTASADRGAVSYARMCAVCHGAEGQGYAADQAPALAHPDFLATVSDEFLAFAIAVGRRGTTMSAWQSDHGGPLSEDDVRDLVAYLRSWQKLPSVTVAESTLVGDVARGKLIFKRACNECHGEKAPYVHILNRQLLVHATPTLLFHAIKKGRRDTKMPGFEQSLPAQGVEDVVAYLSSLPNWTVPGEQPGTASPPPIPLGPVPLNPRGPEPRAFRTFPELTSVDVVARELKRGARMVILDARAPSDYTGSHIAGAVSVPFYDPSPYFAQLPKDTWLVCYCGCPHAESGMLAKQLRDAGFSKVTVLDEGLGAWGAKGHALHTGLTP